MLAILVIILVWTLPKPSSENCTSKSLGKTLGYFAKPQCKVTKVSKFGRARIAEGTRTTSECFYGFFEFSQNLLIIHSVDSMYKNTPTTTQQAIVPFYSVSILLF